MPDIDCRKAGKDAKMPQFKQPCRAAVCGIFVNKYKRTHLDGVSCTVAVFTKGYYSQSKIGLREHNTEKGVIHAPAGCIHADMMFKRQSPL
jgi:hypothetical protein